jgi:hypothetical protein
MLRVDNNAEVVRLPWTLAALFSGRYAVRSGRRVFPTRFKKAQLRASEATAAEHPVPMLADGRRNLWYFLDCFYWADPELDDEDVKALVLQRKRSGRRKLETAHSLMRAEQAGVPARVAIPSELRRAVFERDGGRCAECGSNFDLQYDHVLPVSLGGATTIENLQLLCADCNRRKSDSL